MLEIVAEDRKVDPVEDNYDLVIRINPDPDERLVGRRIREDERLLVAAPDRPDLLQGAPGDTAITVPAVGHVATAADALWRIRTDCGVHVLPRRYGCASPPS